MKVECSRKEFFDALNVAGSATSTRTSLPILQTVRLEAADSGLSIVGCDGEMWAERKILAAIDQSGAVCVSFQLLRDLVSKLPDGQIKLELESENNSLFLRFGHAEWRMMALPAEEFPSIPELAGGSSIRLKMAEIRDSVDAVAYAVADDNSRPILTGVLVAYDGHTLTMVATDTHRLAVTKLKKDGIGSQMTAVVPSKALKAIKGLPLSDEEEVVLQFDENRIGVNSGDSRVVSQLLTGTFPNWERVVPQESTRSWTVDRSEMIDNINRAMILARDSANRVRFSGHGDQILITARSEDKGEAKEEVASINKNGDMDIAFNGKYVLDALNAIKCDGIRAELTESSRPAVFRAADDVEERFCVVMPMALG